MRLEGHKTAENLPLSSPEAKIPSTEFDGSIQKTKVIALCNYGP